MVLRRRLYVGSFVAPDHGDFAPDFAQELAIRAAYIFPLSNLRYGILVTADIDGALVELKTLPKEK